MQGFARECEMEARRRVLPNLILHKHAKFEHEIMLAGQLNKFEIWQEAQWQAKI